MSAIFCSVDPYKKQLILSTFSVYHRLKTRVPTCDIKAKNPSEDVTFFSTASSRHHT